MDEVIADAGHKHLQLFNRGFNENITDQDLMGTHLRVVI